jgi:hypothetical protein
MSPSEFTFKLTVPNDPEGLSVVAIVANHAVEYTNLDKGAGARFVERVRGAVGQAMKGSDGTNCLVVFAAARGQLTMTIGGQSVSEPLPS